MATSSAADAAGDDDTTALFKRRRIDELEKQGNDTRDASSCAPIPAESGGEQQREEAALASKASALTSDAAFEAWCARALADTAAASQLLPASTEDTPEPLLSAEARLVPSALFEGYSFTGSLRPAHVTPQMRPPAGVGVTLPDYASHKRGLARSETVHRRAKVIPVLEGVELETMRESCRLGREVLDIAGRFIRAGVTGDEVDRIVWTACAERELYPSPLNYFGFPKSVCVSVNEVICHGIPDCRPLQAGDIVNLDVSVCYKGLHADLNETFFIGECDVSSQTVVRAAYETLQVAARKIRPGTLYRELGGLAQAEASRHNCSICPSFAGHGVGRLFHCLPDVPHYRKNKAVGVMKPGHVFTVEPNVNFGTKGKDRIWPDEWTAVTVDGQRSAQFEHTFLVTQDGYEVLTARPGTDRFSIPDFDPSFFQR